ncbi:MAG: choice-of-anchor D domain-containing protein, partial [Sedimentisphaerales bacterium]|nr:choice-of-anchor D domain-containing protein [Sedimentisphaerales bacterium]
DSLNAGAFDGETAQWILSEELSGSYFVTMQVNADGAVEEKTSDNNTAASWNAITISEPVQVDVAAVNVNADLAEAAWGDSLSIQYELQSSGDLSGAVTVGFYISQADGLTGEVQIGQAQVNLTADGLFEGDLDLLLPAESPFGRDGDYMLIVSADPDNNIPESNEYNNSAFTNINIGSGLADLAALNISGVPTASAGASFEVFNELANFGSVEAEDFDVYFYLAADNTAIDTGSDTYLGMRHLDSLVTNAVNWTLTTLAIPAGGVEDGTYYLAMQVDTFDDVDEALETNNIIFSEKPLQLRSITVTPDDYEPNNTTGTATDLSIDEDGLIETVTVTLHNNTDADYFSFTVPTNANGFAKLNIVPSDTLNAAAFVYNSDGSQVGGADMDPEFGGEEIFTTFSLTPGREYLVLVRPIGDSFGEYTMDIELGLGTTGDAYETNETTATAYYLGNSSVSLSDANIHNGSDIDYYQFAVPATSTGQMTISVGPDPTLDAILQVFDSAGEFIGSSDVGGAGSVESIAMTGAVGDNYYARVTSWAESTGSYQFDLAFTAARLPDSYEPNDDVASAYELTNDFLTSPTIHSGDVDYYQLTVPELETQLTAYIFNSEGLDGSLAIYDQEGTLLHNVNRSGVNGSEVLMIDGLAGQQQLYLTVTGEEDTTGRYSLELDYSDEETGDTAEPNNQLTTAYSLTLTDGRGELDGLSLHNEADRDYFSFIAPQDTDGTAYVTVWPADEANELNVSLGLFDNSGTTLKSTDATGAGETETLTLTSGLTAGETYYIDVNGWGSTGDYKLTVRTPLLGAATADDVPSVEPLYDVGILPSTGYLLDGTEPEIYVVEEVANANDNDLSFGATPVGNSLTCTFSVLNTGGSSLNISDVTLAGADSGVFSVALADGDSGDPTAANIEPGQSQQYTVTFTPTGMQLYSQATLTVASNDSDESSYNLALSGTGTVSTAKPDIAITDLDEESLTTLTFDDTMLDVTGTASFLIANEGTATLTVTSATLSGTDADVFSVYYTNLADRTTDDYLVIAGGQKLMKIEFSPTSAGTHTATLTLTSNDPDESAVSVQLVGGSFEPDLIVDITPDDGTVANPLDSTLAFGQVVNDGSGGQKGQYPINLVNTGSSSLTVSSIVFSDTAFGIAVTGMDSYPFEIAAGQTISATVEFDPILVGSLTGETMTINSDDPDSSAMQFTLTGQG